AEVSQMPMEDSIMFMRQLELSERDAKIADQVLIEINARLKFLLDVGLDYLNLERPAGTLSGGEAQRIRLATQIGSGLVGVLYVLDEPSIGLHQRDNRRLIETLLRLRDLGNTLIVVEHDEETIAEADWIVDIGPDAGEKGGHIVHSGSVEGLKDNTDSLTGDYLSGRKQIVVPPRRSPEANDHKIEIVGESEATLQLANAEDSGGFLTAITGVTGSGKSSLANENLDTVLPNPLTNARNVPGRHRRATGIDHLD